MAETAALVRRVEALDAAEWAEAIDALESANRAQRSDEIEIALAALRHRAFAALAATPPDRAPAPAAVSPQVGRDELPEAELADLTAGTVRAALLEHGALLVRGVIDADRAAELASGIDRAFAVQAEGKPAADEASAWSFPLALDGPAAMSLGRKWVRGGGGVLMGDSPRLMFEILDLYDRLGLRAVIADYLGGRPVLSANKCTLRRVSLGASGDWHQDGAFLGSGIRALNVWMTLTPCGVDAPGLDLVPRRFSEIVETGAGGAYFDWAVGPETVQDAAGEAGIIRPVFAAGDMLIFDDLFLHRTAIEPEMTRERHAIEMWSFAADAYPAGQVPLVW